MQTNQPWTMKCILVGAEAIYLLRQGRETEAKEKLKNLTSEFEPSDIDYLLMRLRNLL